MYYYVQGWREVLARVFQGFAEQNNVSPPWLVNPNTGRRLKLDIFYPEINVAVRFAGLLAKGQRRQSDEEAEADEMRNDVRAAVCRGNGVALVTIDPDAAETQEGLNSLRSALASAARRAAQNPSSDIRKRNALMGRLNASREAVERVALRLRKPEDLEGLAELWRDREAALVNQTSIPAAPPPRTASRFQPGQAVEHSVFGPGEVRQVVEENGDTLVTVLFVTAGERTLSARLVGDKLKIK